MITFRHLLETIVFWAWVFIDHRGLAPRRGEQRCFIQGPDGNTVDCGCEEALARTRRGIEWARMRRRLREHQ